MKDFLKNKKLAIWDFDGSLVDSEFIHLLSYQDVIQKKIDEEYYYLEIASKGGGAQKIADEFQFPDGLEKLKELKRKRYRMHTDDGKIKVFPFVEDILREQKNMGMTIVVASNSSESANRAILQRQKFDETLFDGFFSPGPDMPRKPAPDMFLAVLTKFGFEPSEAVVFEDTYIGVEAAKNSDIDVFFLRAGHNRNHSAPEGSIDTNLEKILEAYKCL